VCDVFLSLNNGVCISLTVSDYGKRKYGYRYLQTHIPQVREESYNISKKWKK